MAFDLIYANDSAEQLARFPLHIQGIVLENLERLADDPISASNPPSSPLWPSRQLLHFEAEDGVDHYTFFVVWRYHEDENSLRILAIAGVKDSEGESSEEDFI